MAVRLLSLRVGGCGDGGARKVAEEVEGLAEGILGAAVEARRVHAEGCIAQRKERQQDMSRSLRVHNNKKVKLWQDSYAQGCVVAAVAGRLALPLSLPQGVADHVDSSTFNHIQQISLVLEAFNNHMRMAGYCNASRDMSTWYNSAAVLQ